MTEEASTDFDNLLFGIRRSIRYHDRRVSYYEWLHKLVLLATLVAGSFSIVLTTEFANTWPGWLQILPPAFISVLVSIDLVVGTVSKAKLHNGLKQQFTFLESRMQKNGEEDNRKLREWESDRLSIEALEPPVLRVLDTLCHNELLRAMGYKSDYKPLGFFQRAFAHVIDIGADTL